MCINQQPATTQNWFQQAKLSSKVYSKQVLRLRCSQFANTTVDNLFPWISYISDGVIFYFLISLTFEIVFLIILEISLIMLISI